MTVAHPAARPTNPTKGRADSIFFPAMALGMAAVVFTGFAPSWFLRGYPPILAAYAVGDIFVLALFAYDLVQHRTVHRATWIGSAILVTLQPARLVIGQTHWWQAFANWFV